jgi:mannose-6-phosphate isomerase-like protein (cupin superfamily)
MEFAPGLSPGIRNGDCDEILYVLDSERGHPVRLSEHSERTPNIEALGEIFIDGHLYDLTPDTGIYIRPHETFSINNPGPNPIVLVSSQCPDPDREPQFIPPLTAPSTDSASEGRVPLVRLADRRAQPTADRWYRVLVDDEIGSSNATQFVGSIPPGRAPDHFHEYEEVLFILKGEGRMWAGDTNTPIAPGSCIYLPKGQVHCVENTGKDELRLLGVFYPAGRPSVRYDV